MAPGAGRGSRVKGEGVGDTRMCQEEGAAPPLCWRTGKADPGDVGRESSKKRHRKCQCWGGAGGRAWAALSLGM